MNNEPHTMSQTAQFLQAVGPEDECARHGRDWMARTRPLPVMLIDGQPVGDYAERWFCIQCLRNNTEREKLRADKAEQGLKDVQAWADTWFTHTQVGGCGEEYYEIEMEEKAALYDILKKFLDSVQPVITEGDVADAMHVSHWKGGQPEDA